MNNMYFITSAFMMLIICILLRKLFFLPQGSLVRRTCLRFVGSVGAYVLLDYLFVYCFLNTEVSIHIFRGICLLFYMIYVTLPLAWYHFLQSYSGENG